MGWRWMAVVACVATSAAASAAVLCRTATGLVAVRDACKRGETQINPGALGLGSTLLVRDVNDSLVGPVVDLRWPDPLWGQGGPVALGALTVLRKVGEIVLALGVDGAGFRKPAYIDSGFLNFESADCSGPLLLSDRYAPQTDAPLWVLPVVHGSIAYYISARSFVSERVVNSFVVFTDEFNCGAEWGGHFVPPDRCCIQKSTTLRVAAAATLDLTTLGLVPPFHVEGP